MKILHVNLSDCVGGASIAMNRIHTGLRKLGVDSQLLVRNISDPKLLDTNPEIHMISTGLTNLLDRVKYRIASNLGRLQNDPTCFFNSINLFRNQLVNRIRSINPDLVNLHWVGANILRIEDLPKIDKPIVWTLQDMWSFCGAEHYDFLDRSTVGYTKESRSPLASGVDWNRRTWIRKKKAWKSTAVTTVGPCNWIRDKCQDSALWKNRPDCKHVMIPFGLDIQVFRKRDQDLCRKKHGLTGDLPLLLFGADKIESPMKGMNWLVEALKTLANQNFPVRLAFFGSGQVSDLLPKETPIVNLGRIDSAEALSEVYCAADLMLVPSRLESFGQTASESLASGTPVVCFDTSGPRDIVVHQRNGYRAECFNPDDLAEGIRWCLSSQAILDRLSSNAEQHAHSQFDQKLIAKQYLDLYESTLNKAAKSL